MSRYSTGQACGNLDLQSAALFTNLSALDLEYFDLSSTWWPSFISSKPLLFLRINCLVDETHLDFPKLFKHIPRTLHELVISVSLKITSGAWHQGGHFDRSDADSCIVSSDLPNLRALHLDFFDSITVYPDSISSFPKAVSWCASKGVEFTVGEYTIQRQPYKFAARNPQVSRV